MEALRSSYQQSLEELRKEKEMLERQLEYERVRLEAESKKACLESQEKVSWDFVRMNFRCYEEGDQKSCLCLGY